MEFSPEKALPAVSEKSGEYTLYISIKSLQM
jgi:hypothetical protein